MLANFPNITCWEVLATVSKFGSTQKVYRFTISPQNILSYGMLTQDGEGDVHMYAATGEWQGHKVGKKQCFWISLTMGEWVVRLHTSSYS